jgi:O-antigen/teichoic acid export membrane protein
MTLLTASVVLTGTVALFWLFFSRSEQVVRHYERTEDPVRAGRTGVCSLMASVVGMIGGPVTYIGAQTWHRATLVNDLRRSRLLALATLVAGCIATLAAPAYLAAVIAAAIVATLATFEDRHPTEVAVAEPNPSAPVQPEEQAAE